MRRVMSIATPSIPSIKVPFFLFDFRFRIVSAISFEFFVFYLLHRDGCFLVLESKERTRSHEM